MIIGMWSKLQTKRSSENIEAICDMIAAVLWACFVEEKENKGSNKCASTSTSIFLAILVVTVIQSLGFIVRIFFVQV